MISYLSSYRIKYNLFVSTNTSLCNINRWHPPIPKTFNLTTILSLFDLLKTCVDCLISQCSVRGKHDWFWWLFAFNIICWESDLGKQYRCIHNYRIICNLWLMDYVYPLKTCTCTSNAPFVKTTILGIL